MINVVYHRKYHRVTIKGHAYSGEAGHDLICSACSVLAYTLAANVANMEQYGQVRNMLTDLKKGDAEICCKPNSRFESVITMIFDSICVGFELLANDYPENIKYEIRD